MKRNYIKPEMTLKLFCDAVSTTEEVPAESPVRDTSAVVQAKKYMFTLNDKKLRDVLVMRK